MVVAGPESRALYPPQTYENGVGGRAVVECDLEPPKLTDCQVLSEAPPGYGFGAAAITIAGSLSVEPEKKTWEVDSVRLPVVFANPIDLVTPLTLDEAVGCYGVFARLSSSTPSSRDAAALDAARAAALEVEGAQGLSINAVESRLRAARPLDYPANMRCSALR
jgi:TonB family protein